MIQEKKTAHGMYVAHLSQDTIKANETSRRQAPSSQPILIETDSPHESPTLMKIRWKSIKVWVLRKTLLLGIQTWELVSVDLGQLAMK